MDQPAVPASVVKFWTDDERRRRQLNLVLDGLAAELDSIGVELVATRAIRANGGDDDEHDPDGIPLSSVLEQLESQKIRLIAQSREVESAVTALAEGKDGICRNCGRPIAAERLEIRPAARTCVVCAGRAGTGA